MNIHVVCVWMHFCLYNLNIRICLLGLVCRIHTWGSRKKFLKRLKLIQILYAPISNYHCSFKLDQNLFENLKAWISVLFEQEKPTRKTLVQWSEKNKTRLNHNKFSEVRQSLMQFLKWIYPMLCSPKQKTSCPQWLISAVFAGCVRCTGSFHTDPSE